jgi:hypothetical protein
VVSAGETVTCTFTNSLKPKLTLLKTVTNDNGGTALDTAWTLSAAGPTPISGTEGQAAITNAVVDPGSYDLSESAGPAGYTNGTTWVCVGGTTVDADTVTLAFGDSATCTITNNDVPPQLHLRKIVVNDNGGTATVADFTLTANGTGANDITGTSPVDSGAGLLADTFALSETSPANYTASAWVCVGGAQDGSNITVGIGGSATCTITNNDVPPHLTLDKIVSGGAATGSEWTLTATGTGAQVPLTLSGPGGPGSADVVSGTGFDAGTYNLSEIGAVAQYTNGTTWTCSTNSGAPVSLLTSITLGLGDSAVCSITNTFVVAQSCSPGYWKQDQHFDSYPTGVTPSTLFGSIFNTGSVKVGKPDASQGTSFASLTLLQVLNLNGGGFNAMARQAVSAYLNSLTMAYPYSAAQVIALVDAAFASGDPTAAHNAFASILQNENCPLN